MTDHLKGPQTDDQKAPVEIRRKRSFTLHEKRISESMQIDFIALFDTNQTKFRKQTAALLRENPDLFNMNEIGTVADEHSHVTLEKFQGFLADLLKPQLTLQIFKCIDSIDDNHDIVSLTAITRFLSGRSKVADRQKTIIDEMWLVQTLKGVDIGQIDENGNNMIELEEFRHFFQNLEKEVPEELVEKVFHDIDKDNDGHISTFEYFRWREGFKAHSLQQYLPAKIRKSTTKLKIINSGIKPKHKKKTNYINYKRDGTISDDQYSDDDEDDDEDEDDDNDEDRNDEMEQLRVEIEKLKQENIEKDKIINKLKEENERITNKSSEKDEITENLKIENKKHLESIGSLEQELKEKEKGNKALNANVIELESKMIKFEKLLTESQEKVNENDKLLKQSHEKIQDRDKTIAEYGQKMEELQIKYAEEMDKTNKMDEMTDINKLNKLLLEKEDEIKKIKHENEAELKMIERDKDNLWSQLEGTYQIVNDELIENNKHSKKKKIKKKQIENPNELRNELKKLKSKIDIKDKKLSEYENNNNNNDSLEIDVENVLHETEDNDNNNNSQYPFKNLFIFLKDF